MNRRRLFVTIAIIVVIAATIIIATVLLVTRDSDMRVQRIMDGTALRVRDFENSRLRLNENGTFEIEIIVYSNTKLFAGIGTWTREGDVYSFYYTDAHTTRSSIEADSSTNAPDYDYIFKTYKYNVDRGTGWVIFFDHMGDPYHFG